MSRFDSCKEKRLFGQQSSMRVFRSCDPAALSYRLLTAKERPSLLLRNKESVCPQPCDTKSNKLSNEEREEELEKHRTDFMQVTDNNIRKRLIRDKINDGLTADEWLLAARRELLKNILCEEEMNYHQEMRNVPLLSDHRVDVMKKTVQKLRDEKEAARLAFVEEKYLQQLAQTNDELRAKRSKDITLKIALDRQRQIEEKKMAESRRKEEEKVWLELSKNDVKAKEGREEQDALKALHRQDITACALRDAIKQKELQKQWEMGQYLNGDLETVNQNNALKKEEICGMKQKQKDKAQLAAMFKDAILKKQAQVERDEQEVNAVDFADLSTLLTNQSDDRLTKRNRMRKLNEEQHSYLEYVQQDRLLAENIETKVDNELQKIIDEVDKQKDEARTAQNKASNELLFECSKFREFQSANKAEERIKNNEVKAAQRAIRLARTKYDDCLNAEQVLCLKDKKSQCRKDILGQIAYNKQLGETQKAENLRSEESYNCEAVERENKIRALIDSEPIPKMHPMYKRVLNRNMTTHDDTNVPNTKDMNCAKLSTCQPCLVVKNPPH